MANQNTSIWAAKTPFDVGCRVIKWDEPNGLSFYPSGKYVKRFLDLPTLQKRTKLFCIHHSNGYKTKDTYDTLIKRGLSVTFAIDDDINQDTNCATIYQFLDICDYAWSQKGFNDVGSGVEIALNPLAGQFPDLYSPENQQKYNVTPHNTVTETIHHQAFKFFKPTDAQINALIRLIYGYLKAFPSLKPQFPKDASGNYNTNVVDLNQSINLVNHYSIDQEKIDCAGIHHAYIEQEVQKLLDADKQTPKDPTILDKIFSIFKK